MTPTEGLNGLWFKLNLIRVRVTIWSLNTAESHKLYAACYTFAEESRTQLRQRVKNLIRAVARVRVLELLLERYIILPVQSPLY